MPLNFNDFFNTKEGSMNNPRLEEFLNKTREAAETMSKKGAEGIELGRKKVELLDAKAKLAKLYERYGKLSYSSYINENVNPDELADVANDIASLRDKIDFLTVELEEAKTAFNETVAAATKWTKETFNQDKSNTDVDIDVDVEVVVSEAQNEESDDTQE